jgi:hypothetical protein
MTRFFGMTFAPPDCADSIALHHGEANWRARTGLTGAASARAWEIGCGERMGEATAKAAGVVA